MTQNEPSTINKKTLVIVLTVLAIPFMLFLTEWCLSSGGLKRIYYNHFLYNGDKIRVVEDVDFTFHEKGVSKSYELNSSYYVPHRILLIPNSTLVPVGYEFSGEVMIEIYDRKKNLLLKYNVDEVKNIFRKNKEDYYGNYLIYHGKQKRVASSIFAFELGEIPFNLIRLKWSRLRNMQIKITVLKPDKSLREYCDSATLAIVPDLRMW